MTFDHNMNAATRIFHMTLLENYMHHVLIITLLVILDGSHMDLRLHKYLDEGWATFLIKFLLSQKI